MRNGFWSNRHGDTQLNINRLREPKKDNQAQTWYPKRHIHHVYTSNTAAKKWWANYIDTEVTRFLQEKLNQTKSSTRNKSPLTKNAWIQRYKREVNSLLFTFWEGWTNLLKEQEHIFGSRKCFYHDIIWPTTKDDQIIITLIACYSRFICYSSSSSCVKVHNDRINE